MFRVFLPELLIAGLIFGLLFGLTGCSTFRTPEYRTASFKWTEMPDYKRPSDYPEGYNEDYNDGVMSPASCKVHEYLKPHCEADRVDGECSTDLCCEVLTFCK